MEISVQAAEAILSELIDRAIAGKDIVLVENGKPIARLVPVTKSGFRFGGLEDKLTGPGPDFFKPMSEAELRLWEGGNESSR